MAGATFKLENADAIAASIKAHGEAGVKAARIEMKKFGRDVKTEASNVHRYENHGGILKRSVRFKPSSDGMSVEIYADLGIAPYARRIHYGWGTWAPDLYLQNAFDKFKDGLGDRLQKAIGKAMGAK